MAGERRSACGVSTVPEKGQDFGTKAKQVTSILVFAKVVEVEPVTTDSYGRTVAFVKVGDTLVNEELIRQGFAWVFTRYCDKLSRGIENLPLDSLLLQFGLSEETRLDLLLEAVGIALDVDRGGMVKDPIEDLLLARRSICWFRDFLAMGGDV